MANHTRSTEDIVRDVLRSAGKADTKPAKTKTETRRGARIVRGILTALWLVAVPLFLAVHVDRLFGPVLGTIPGVGLGVLGVLALVAGVIAAYVLHHKHAIFMLAAVPAAGAWIGYAWLGGTSGTWLGLVTGLGAGLLAYAARRRRS